MTNRRESEGGPVVPLPAPVAGGTTGALAGLSTLRGRSSTAEQAADALRRHVTEGLLRPGTQLREEAVAGALGISRNTVREAFRALSREGLVEHSMNRGVFVRQISPADVTDIYRTRRLLQPLGLRTVAARAQAVRTLDATVTAAEEAVAAGDWDAVGTADIAFHRVLVDACESVRISRLFDLLFAELRLAFAAIDSPQALHEPYVARNRRLVSLLVAGNVDAACAELDTYLADAETQLLEAL